MRPQSMSGRMEDPVVLMDDEETNAVDDNTTKDDQPTNDNNNNDKEDDGDDPEEFVVEAIRARRKDPKTGNDVFLVKWEDYPESDNTWEPAENLKCPEIVQKFLEDEANKRKRRKVDKIHSNSPSSKSQSQPATKRPRRSDGSKSRVFVEDDDTDEEDDDSVDGAASSQNQKQKQTTNESFPEPVVKGFDRGRDIEKILTASIGDNDKMYFFIKWQGLAELELLGVDELEKNAPYELCRWYRERFFCNIKYNKLP